MTLLELPLARRLPERTVHGVAWMREGHPCPTKCGGRLRLQHGDAPCDCGGACPLIGKAENEDVEAPCGNTWIAYAQCDGCGHLIPAVAPFELEAVDPERAPHHVGDEARAAAKRRAGRYRAIAVGEKDPQRLRLLMRRAREAGVEARHGVRLVPDDAPLERRR